jgi:hypothetical protein
MPRARKPDETVVEPSALPAITPAPVDGTSVPVRAPDEEPSLEEYEQRRLELIAKLPPKDQRPTKLVAKLALITGLVGQIRKSGRNTFHNYNYAKESDLVEAIRPLLAELGIWVWWSLFADPDKGIVHHTRLSQVVKDRNKNIVGEAETLTVVTAIFRFIDGETDEKTEPQMMMGYGDDNSDKGLYKALTGMEKYFLFKTFLVSTGDDPEGDASADRRAAAREAQSAPQVDVRRSAPQQRQSQPTAGGRQQDGSKPQIKQLGELIRQSGVRSSEGAAMLIGEKIGREVVLEGDDKAKALTEAIAALKPNEIAKAIFELRKQIAESENPGQSDAGPHGQAAQDEVAAGERESAEADVPTTSEPDDPQAYEAGEAL